MVKVEFDSHFERKTRKIKNEEEKLKVKKQIVKIIENPEIGKPMRYARKGTREVYTGSFRLSYAYLEKENKLVFLDIYHKDEQ